MTEAGLPVVPKSSEEWRLAVKEYLRTHPGTRLIDLKEFTDPDRGPLFVWAQRMLGQKELFEEPRNKTLYIHGEQVARKEPADIVVRIIKVVPSFKDSNGVDRKLATEDVVSLPDSTAKALIARGAAEEISVPKPEPSYAPAASPEASTDGGEPPSAPKAAVTPGVVPPNIPEQLRRPTFRFVLVKGRGKNPIEKGWQDGANYPHDHDRLLSHLARGGNYGVLCGRGLVVIDADDPEVRETVLASLPQTFTVKTGRASGDGRHFYFLCEDLLDPIRLARPGDTKGTIGDVQSTGKQVIGPGSIHPSGNRYEVLEARPLATVTAEQIRFALRDFLPPVETDTLEDFKREMPQGCGDFDQLRVDHIIPLDGLTRHGSKYQGPCPWHGSDTGSNFTIDVEKNVWHCFRHSSGGGPLQAIAVMEGVISCEESARGGLRGEKFLKTLEHAEKKHGLLRQTRSSQVRWGPDVNPLWRYTVDSSNKLPLDQLWRWPECFALIGLKCSVPLETCEGELLEALERSGADVDQVQKALGTVQKLYGKYAPGEDKLDKKARDNIRGCGLKVGVDFTAATPDVKGCEIDKNQAEERAIAANHEEEPPRDPASILKREAEEEEDLEFLKNGEWLDVIREALGEDIAGVEDLKAFGIYSIAGANLSNDHSTKTPLLHLFIPGDSQVGKSWFFRYCGKTLLPPTSFLSFTSMSAKGLDYLADEMKDPHIYRGKILFIDETADLTPEARAKLKVIMSGGQDEVSNLTVDEKKKSRLQSFKGMPTVWSCSAEAFEDAERQFLNRPLILSVDESEEQTLNIQSMQRDQEAYGSLYAPDSKKSQALRLMSKIREEKDAEVLVLFSDYYKPDDESSRGMIPQFGSLVKAIAFSNRFARPTVTAPDGHPIIFATFEDGIEATQLWGKFIEHKSTHLASRFIEVLEALNELPRKAGQTELDIGEVNDRGKTAEDLTVELDASNGKGWGLRYVKNMLSTLGKESLAEYHECPDGKNRWVALMHPSHASHFVTYDNVTDGGEMLARRVSELKKRSSHRHTNADMMLPEDLFEIILPKSKIPQRGP